MKSPSASSFEALLRRLRMRHFQLLALLDQSDSLSEAAQRLSLTQPAVSKMLIEIEESLGTPLFERGRRGVRPTASGRAAIRRARAMVGEIALLAEEVTRVNEGAGGLLQIGTFSVTAIVPSAIVQLMHREPRVQVRIKEGPINALLAHLLDGALDCVFAAISPDALAAGDASRLHWQNVIDDRLCALVSESHPLAQAGALQWRDCAQARWVTMPPETVVRQRFMEAFVREGLEPPVPVVETMSPVTIAALVRQDPTLIGLSRYETADQTSLLEGVQRLALAPAMQLPPMCLITRRTNDSAPMVLAFAECVTAVAHSGVSLKDGPDVPRPTQL